MILDRLTNLATVRLDEAVIHLLKPMNLHPTVLLLERALLLHLAKTNTALPDATVSVNLLLRKHAKASTSSVST